MLRHTRRLEETTSLAETCTGGFEYHTRIPECPNQFRELRQRFRAHLDLEGGTKTDVDDEEGKLEERGEALPAFPLL